MTFEQTNGSTDLTNDELHDLKIKFITTQQELDAAEQMNIAEALLWCESKKFSITQILDILFFNKLHKLMFKNVWKWAGRYRTTGKNIGVEAYKITTELKNLIDNTYYQINHCTYSDIEILTRFHHQLVWVHPFPNGNGRHARIITDLLAKVILNNKLTWGGFKLGDYKASKKLRDDYIYALRQADNGNYNPLMKFINS